MKRYLFAPVVLILAAIPCFGAPKPGTWKILAPVPHHGTGVEGMSVADVGDKIIAALGYDFGDTNTTRIYDIASNTWSLGANAPGTSSEGAGVSHGGLFYTAGGRLFTVRNDLWSYDPASDTWSILAHMNVARAGLAIATVGNSIYAIGGRTSPGGPCTGGAMSSVERYDIDQNVWTQVSPMPFPLSDRAAATVGGKIYVFGGCSGNFPIFTNETDVYDPVTDTWSTSPADMPTARAGMYGIATKGDAIYVIGGWDGIHPGLQTNEADHVAQDTWTT